jgi:LysR family transcriptional regulator, glycine cleavage system transcriptional activator
MKDLPLNALRAFASAAENGGIRSAARDLAVSHSAVSRHIRALERWLGVGLLEHDPITHGFRLTSQGQRLAVAVQGALKDIRTAVDAVREQRSRHAVTLSVAPSFATRWLLPRLPAFERGNPKVEISIVVDQRLEDLRVSGADLAIRMGQGPWVGADAQPLMNDALYPVMNPAAWKKAGQPRALADLCHVRLLHDRDPQATWALWRGAHGPENLDVRKGPRFSSSDLVLHAAAQGLGVALARHRLVAEDIRNGVLVRPFGPQAVVLDNAYWIITTPQRPLRPAMKLVIAWLRREAGRQPGAGVC